MNGITVNKVQFWLTIHTFGKYSRCLASCDAGQSKVFNLGWVEFSKSSDEWMIEGLFICSQINLLCDVMHYSSKLSAAIKDCRKTIVGEDKGKRLYKTSTGETEHLSVAKEKESMRFHARCISHIHPISLCLGTRKGIGYPHSPAGKEAEEANLSISSQLPRTLHYIHWRMAWSSLMKRNSSRFSYVSWVGRRR